MNCGTAKNHSSTCLRCWKVWRPQGNTSNGVDATVTAEVQKFVNYIFPKVRLEQSLSITPTSGPNNSVDLTLTTNLPTA